MSNEQRVTRDEGRVRWGAAVMLVLCMAGAASAARIEFRSEPDFSAIEPVHHSGNAPARYTLSVVDDAGRPIPVARVKYTLLSPPVNAFFTSDFPIVEGTTLMEGDAFLADGTLSWEYLTPIRGDYRLVVDATPGFGAAAFAPVHDEIRYHVNEKASNIRNGVLLMVILFGVGFVSGYIIVRPRTIRPAIALVVLALVSDSAMPPPASAHGGHEHHEVAAAPAPGGVTKGDSAQLALSFDPPSGTVGKLVTIRAVATDPDSKPLANVRFTVRLHHLEDDKDMYTSTFVAPDGTFTWRNQFFDGAEHQIIVTAAPVESGAFTPVTAAYTMDVEAICPPDNVVARMWTFHMAIVVAGMACGAFATRRSRRSAAEGGI